MTATIARERITIAEAAARLGVSERTVRALASRGEIPGVAKIGRRWTIGIVELSAYISRQQGAACRSARVRLERTGAVLPSGVGRRSAAGNIDGLYAQTIRRLRDAATKRIESGS